MMRIEQHNYKGMMMYNPTFDMASGVKLCTDMFRMYADSQYVIGLRVAGMCGMLPHASTENIRMVTEKGDAVAESIGAALREVSRGARSDQVMAAALKPYGKRTRANARRLGGRR
jgi:hypothetical protein